MKSKKIAEMRVPSDLQKSLNSNKEAKELWNEITPVARRDWILWIITARQKETRARRIEVACSKLSSGKKRVCCFGGIKWLLKDTKGMDKGVLKILQASAKKR